MARELVALLVVALVGVCLVHVMALEDDTDGRLSSFPSSFPSSSSSSVSADKRGTRRVTRDRYKLGYLFGKRSGLGYSASDLLQKLASKAISVEDLTTSLRGDPELAERVARHLDRNGDGYVSVSELL